MSELTKIPYIFGGIFGPAALWFWWATRRARHKAAEREGQSEEPFAPSETPTVGVLLQSFTAAEQTILRGQWRGMRIGFCVFGWVLFVVLSSSLLPSAIEGTRMAADAGGNDAIAVWYSFLDTLAGLGRATCGLLGILSGFIAVAAISLGSSARHWKTRPVLRRSIYWAKVLPGIVTLLGAYVAAVGLTLVVMVALHGPVFLHLAWWHGVGQTVPGTIHLGSHSEKEFPIRRFVRLIETSAPRLLLSVATEMLVGFSVAAAWSLQPLRFLRSKGLGVGKFWILILALEGVTLGSRLLPRWVSDALFLYGRLGSPPPWSFALVPLGLVAALLSVGGAFNERLEF
jgi:hypothetical protein